MNSCLVLKPLSLISWAVVGSRMTVAWRVVPKEKKCDSQFLITSCCDRGLNQAMSFRLQPVKMVTTLSLFL